MQTLIVDADNNYFNSKINIWDYIRIITTRIKKVTIDVDDIDNSNKISKIFIEMNNYCGYILYETIDNTQ